MNVYGSFPAVRMRRMRRNDFSRRLMRETVLTANDFLYPVFIVDGKNRTQKVDSMPGVERYSFDRAAAQDAGRPGSAQCEGPRAARGCRAEETFPRARPADRRGARSLHLTW